MLRTRTGNFPIGFRRGWSDWQKDLAGVIGFARSSGFGVVDVGADSEAIEQVVAAGLQVGTADVKDWRKLLSPDKAVRQEGLASVGQYLKEAVAAGARTFFVVMIPEKPELKRRENFAFMAESMAALAPTLESLGARIAIEGWPGPGALCCTPEGCRALFKEVPSAAMAINYDPSHLIRMGIDPIRFLEEFVGRVAHVHGKDTEVLAENLYEFGHEQPATFASPFGFGGHAWRYTIPGHGQMRWTKAFSILQSHGYAGAVSIELEDANFNGSEAGEKAGMLAGGQFLASC